MTAPNSLVDTSDETYKKDRVPKFGHNLLKYWRLDPGFINLNHGSYGLTPAPVSQACAKLDARIEGNPDKFVRIYYQGILASVRARISKLIGAEPDEVVIVPNTTLGVFTVLRNIEWKAGDILISTNVAYTAIAKTVQYFRDIIPGLQLSLFDITAPTTHAEIIERFCAHVASIKSSAEFSKPDPPKIVLVFEALASNPGLLLPWEKIVEISHKENILTIVDAAHAIGQQVNINLGEINPDFWISTCYKWLYTKRGCAILYVPKRNQRIIKSSIPTSFGYISPQNDRASDASDFVEKFEWTGTLDMTSFLSITPALDFREWLGGETKINDYTRSLALAGGKRVAEILGTSLMDQTNDSELTLNMVNVRLPLPETPQDKTRNMIVRSFTGRTLIQYKCSVTAFYYNATWWARLSAQVYNEISDFEYMGSILLLVCRDILETDIDENGNSRVIST